MAGERGLRPQSLGMNKLHMLTEKQLLELFRSGNFTIAYHDNQDCSVYEGRYKDYEDLPDIKGALHNDSGYTDGYTPSIVYILVKALKGKTLSI